MLDKKNLFRKSFSMGIKIYKDREKTTFEDNQKVEK